MNFIRKLRFWFYIDTYQLFRISTQVWTSSLNKEIIGETVGWKPNLNLWMDLRDFNPLFSLSLRSCIKHEAEFLQVSKHLKVGYRTRLHLVYSTHFSVFGNPDDTLCLVFDIQWTLLKSDTFGTTSGCPP